jgi:predicted RNase H-like HicB family nuclease
MNCILTAIFKKIPNGFIGYIEELPGANTQGKTLEETRTNLRKAVQMVIKASHVLEDEFQGDCEVIREPLIICDLRDMKRQDLGHKIETAGKIVKKPKLTAIIEREKDGFVALCPEWEVASQGDSIEMARDNLQNAMKLFFETASTEEMKHRLHGEIYVTQLEVMVD